MDRSTSIDYQLSNKPVSSQTFYLVMSDFFFTTVCLPTVGSLSNDDGDGDGYKASSKPLFANLKILDVFSIYSLQVSSFMYLYHNDALPISFTQIFQTGNQIHQYSTRYSDFYRPHTCRTNIKKISILFQGPRIWNSLPNDIKNAPSFSIFKRVMIKPFLVVRQNVT